MFQIVPQGIIALTAVLMSWALAVVLFRVSAPGSVARKLSLLLVFEGLTLGSSNVISYFLVSPDAFNEQHPWLGMAQGIVHTFGDCGMIALYPPFLAAALRTPLTRPFAGKRGRVISMTVAALLFVFVFWRQADNASLTVLYLAMALVFSYAFIASIHAWYIATGIARSRARIFTFAFGFRDVCWNFIYLLGIWEMWFAPQIADWPENPAFYIIYALGTLIAVPLIAYGILRTQLFDIDLKIRWTIKQSTLAGIIIAIVFAVSEGASQFLSDELGAIPGLLAAAVVMFFLAPLQRFAENVASTAMPNTHNTPEYAAFRKMQVYEEAVSEAHAEGGISSKERTLLVRLRDSLEISESDAEAIEGELLGGAA